jgi:hypothetical protein
MDGIALQRALKDRLQGVVRTCLRLDMEPGAAVSGEPESGFGGQPWWPTGETWPVCESCGASLAFVCQLRLDGGGHWRPDTYDLLSVFFCRACSQPDDALFAEYPGGDRCCLRLLRLRAQPLAPLDLAPGLSVQARLTPHRVRGVPVLDAPAWQDVVDEFTAIAPQALKDLHIAYELAVLEVLRHAGNIPQHQLGGYPHWAGTQSYWPECRWCGGQMYLLAQFVPSPALDIPWGKERWAYLFCCTEPCDPEALTLVLQG